MTDLTKATFLASIAPIQSGIQTGGDGLRVKLDIPETEMSEAIKLVAMKGKRLKVTIEVMNTSKPDDGRKIHI